MRVQNRIVKIQKRNRALVTFDEERIVNAILRAARSIGGFQEDFLSDINNEIFDAWKSDEKIAEFLANAVVICLNADPHHLITNFPPTIETIQDKVIHILRGYGFPNTADAYECYRWGRHWLREEAITDAQFVGNGLPASQMQEALQWNRKHRCESLVELNEIVATGGIRRLVEESHAAYESFLDDAADRIIQRLDSGDDLRMLWICGPSSSGKTTTTVKLTQRLQKYGLRFLMLNLDDYFWGSVEHPTDWLNDRNFEQPEALDIQLLNQQLRELLDGKTIEKPLYSFKDGRRSGRKSVKLGKGQMLLLDCLHGLYPPITEGINSSMQFRLYVENLNILYEGDGKSRTLTKFTDIRLIRRMLRDAQHRNHHPLTTILHWHYVRAGELFSIIPLMGLADYVVNTGLPFDLPALKPFFEKDHGIFPKWEEIIPYRGFLDAHIRYERVRRLLDSVEGLTREQISSLELIPGDAVIREFIGGSTIQIPHNE